MQLRKTARIFYSDECDFMQYGDTSFNFETQRDFLADQEVTIALPKNGYNARNAVISLGDIL